MPEQTAQLLANRYRLHEPIARGGMAVVWRATDERLNRAVAVKVLHTRLAGDANFRERFRREAVAAASFNHPNIVTVYDTGEDGDAHFIVMELVQGPSLSRMLGPTGRLDPAETVTLLRSVLAALAYAHDRGVIHRDIKPANILLSPRPAPGITKVGDFGIARAISSTDLTATGAIIGTASYLAPEQAEGKKADNRADLYSLACVAYRCLTGRLPWTADNEMGVALARTMRPPEPLAPLCPDAPKRLVQVVEAGLTRDKTERYQSAEEMADALSGLRGAPVRLEKRSSRADGGRSRRAKGTPAEPSPPTAGTPSSPLVAHALTAAVAEPAATPAAPADGARDEAAAARVDALSARSAERRRARATSTGATSRVSREASGEASGPRARVAAPAAVGATGAATGQAADTSTRARRNGTAGTAGRSTGQRGTSDGDSRQRSRPVSRRDSDLDAPRSGDDDYTGPRRLPRPQPTAGGGGDRERRALSRERAARQTQRRRQLRALMFAGAAVLVLVLLFTFAFGGDGPPEPVAAPSTTAATPPRVEQVFDFDPEGDDGTENRDQVRAVTDGDESTTWSTVEYRSANFGGLKSGVGLGFDLGRPVTPRKVAVTAEPGTVFELRTSDAKSADPAAWETVPGSTTTVQPGNGDEATPVTVTVDTGDRRSRYWLLWLTTLSERPGGKFQSSVAEVVFSPTGRGTPAGAGGGDTGSDSSGDTGADNTGGRDADGGGADGSPGSGER